MAYETGQQLYHRVELEGRDKLTVSGVEDVERFDEGCIVMATCEGTLIVTGEGLHIGKLSLDGGELQVDGRVEALTYEEQQAPRGSWLTRLLGLGDGWRTMWPVSWPPWEPPWPWEPPGAWYTTCCGCCGAGGRG